jgi:hypothetical protein
MTSWTETIENGQGADATRTITDGKISYDISNVGTEDWHIQLKQDGVSLTAGKTYKVSYTITSTAARQIKSGVMSATYEVYGNKDPELAANEETTVTYEFTMAKDDDAAEFYISLGKIKEREEDTPASTITISNISLVEVEE